MNPISYFVLSVVFISLLFVTVRLSAFFPRKSDSAPIQSGQNKENSYPYEPPLIIANMELCKNSSDLNWIIYSYSAPKMFEARSRIRKTWANTLLFKDFSFKIVFILGRDSDDIQQKKVEEVNNTGYRACSSFYCYEGSYEGSITARKNNSIPSR